MRNFSKRGFLASVGSLAVGSLAGCTNTFGSQPHIVISVSKGLVSETTQLARKKIFNVCENYIGQALDSRLGESVRVKFETEPYDLNGTNAQDLFKQFDERVSGQLATLSHICLCGDVSGDVQGHAEIMDAPCYPNNPKTNIGVVTNAHKIHNRHGIDVEPALPVRSSDVIDNHFANRALGVLIHEIGHNICLKHKIGDAWYGTEAPDVYDPIQDKNNIYLSPMLGFYYYENGGLPSLDDKQSSLPTYTGVETLHYGVVYPPDI